MAEVNLDQSLLSLESEAKRLAEASKKTNTILQALQLRLKAANIGLEYWVEHKPLVIDAASGGTMSVWLGFAKIENEWQIAVKVPANDATLGWYVFGTDRGPVPLVKTTRETRQAALPLLADLVEGLRIKVAQKADAIESAARRFER